MNFAEEWKSWRPLIVITLWMIALAVAWERLEHARVEFGNRANQGPELQREDGNSGHTQIDFGGQYLLGRTLATGCGHQLYHRQAQWPVAWQIYPEADETTLSREQSFPAFRRKSQFNNEQYQHDAESMMSWVMGKDAAEWRDVPPALAPLFASTHPLMAAVQISEAKARLEPLVEPLNTPAIGGPLYPPVHAMWMAPVTMLLNPAQAYRGMQILSVLLAIACGGFIAKLSRISLPWPLAVIAVLLFPGFRSGLDLAQNQVLSLTILLAGWYALDCRRPIIAGCVWGFLAFKPSWAAAFLLVPVVLGQWRMVLSMAICGGVQILLTLPVVGVQAWFDWLAVGREASATYNVNENWIQLSRDLSGLVRRVTIDFQLPATERENPLAKSLATALWLSVMAMTVVVTWVCHRTPFSSSRQGFLLLGAYLSGYRFMYYDALLSIVGLAMIFAARDFWPRFVVISDKERSHWAIRRLWPVALLLSLYAVENWLMQQAIEWNVSFGAFGTPSTQVGGMPEKAPKISVNTTIYHAIDTYLLLALWASVGVWLLWQTLAAKHFECETNIRGTHEALTDQHSSNTRGV
ncbi:MAG: glycosyltransferase family 87 protein [Fimbriiglobus sp.]